MSIYSRISLTLLLLSSALAQAMPISVVRIETSQVLTSTVPVKMTFDSAGNLHAVGQSIEGGVVAGLYAADGQQIWRQHYNGPDSPYTPMAITRDGTGHLLVTAVTSGANPDYLTLKFDGAGNIVWTNRLDGAGGAADSPRAITTDVVGNAYITGDTFVSSTIVPFKGTILTRAITTVSYSPSGETRWRNDFQPSVGGRTADAIVVDGHGRVFVSGMTTTFADPRSPQDAWVILSLQAGNGMGDSIYSRTSYSGGWGLSGESRLVIGPGGGLIFAGRKRSSVPTTISVVRFGTNSTVLSTTDTPFAGWNNEGGLTDLQLDPQGNIYVGQHYRFPMQYDSGDNFRVSRVAPSGQLEWEAQHDGVFSLDDVMTTMQVQAAGAVYAAGTSKLPGGGLEWNTVKFDSQGSVAWNERFGSETKTDFRPAALRVDELNYLWVAGSAPGTSGSGTDLLLLKYSTARPALIPMGAHQFSVEFNSRPGSTNRIRESGDLITWHDLATRVADATGRVRYEVDRNGLTNRVFFRCDLE